MNLNNNSDDAIPSFFTSLSSRLVIENIFPSVDNGRFTAKFIINDPVKIGASIFCDGHDVIQSAVNYWPARFIDYPFMSNELKCEQKLHVPNSNTQNLNEQNLNTKTACQKVSYTELPLYSCADHRHFREVSFDALGKFSFQILAWINPYASMVDFIQRKLLANEDIADHLLELIHWLHVTIKNIFEANKKNAQSKQDVQNLAAEKINTVLISLANSYLNHNALSDSTNQSNKLNENALNLFLDSKINLCKKIFQMLTTADFLSTVNCLNCRNFLTHSPVYSIVIDKKLANFANWYELFPRSQSDIKNQHGTLRDVIKRLPNIAKMGFNVLYFPPIHPIGITNRKGRNNQLQAEKNDIGSPYAIGSETGGHTAIHPELGNYEDFKVLIQEASHWGIELALDFAVQCSPDHPWIRQHIDWFNQDTNGNLPYAENPPKKYQDIVSLNFYADKAIPDLWLALKEVVLFWVKTGIKIFRVDNPHTKPIPFWEWLISVIKNQYPEVIFLSEAFTYPSMMYRLAKCGFSQSYTYFIWRQTKNDIQTYLEQINSGELPNYFRPNFFVNTPDINPQFLQTGNRSTFLIRVALATTLSGLWGMYSGFEWCEATRCMNIESQEEYANSEKYQLQQRDWNQPNHIINEISQLNAIRFQNSALHSHNPIQFIPTSNANIICFKKTSIKQDNTLIVAITTHPTTVQCCQIEIPADIVRTNENKKIIFENLLDEHFFEINNQQLEIQINPQNLPYVIYRVNY